MRNVAEGGTDIDKSIILYYNKDVTHMTDG